MWYTSLKVLSSVLDSKFARTFKLFFSNIVEESSHSINERFDIFACKMTVFFSLSTTMRILLCLDSISKKEKVCFSLVRESVMESEHPATRPTIVQNDWCFWNHERTGFRFPNFIVSCQYGVIYTITALSASRSSLEHYHIDWTAVQFFVYSDADTSQLEISAAFFQSRSIILCR